MLNAVWAGALSWCKNQFPLCHFPVDIFITGFHTVFSTHSSETARIAWWTFSTFLLFLLMEGRSQHDWSSTDISPLLKQLNHSYTCVLPMAVSLKASLSIVTVSTAVFPLKETKFCTHTHTLFLKISHLNLKKNRQTRLQTIRKVARKNDMKHAAKCHLAE